MANVSFKQLKEYAASIGAEIETYQDEVSRNLQAIAPDGMVWTASDGVSLVYVYYYHVPNARQEAYNDLYNRMKQGLYPESD